MRSAAAKLTSWFSFNLRPEVSARLSLDWQSYVFFLRQTLTVMSDLIDDYLQLPPWPHQLPEPGVPLVIVPNQTHH